MGADMGAVLTLPSDTTGRFHPIGQRIKVTGERVPQ